MNDHEPEAFEINYPSKPPTLKTVKKRIDECRAALKKLPNSESVCEYTGNADDSRDYGIILGLKAEIAWLFSGDNRQF